MLLDYMTGLLTVFLCVVSEMADCLVLLDMINKLHSFLMMLNSVASIMPCSDSYLSMLSVVEVICCKYVN